jgi:uncharacterized membrane protein YgdD (TMEM256/DUF423 family)
MSPAYRFPLLAAGIFGAVGVGLGAFGAHALRGTLTELGTRDRWETAVFYQLAHAVALLGISAGLRSAEGASINRLTWAARCWLGGITFFSGSLYVMSLNAHAPLWFKIVIPPLGGSLFVLGWLFAAAAALKKAA